MISQHEKLKKITEKAVENGWYQGKDFLDIWEQPDGSPNKIVQLLALGRIFRKDFAKAIWGEEEHSWSRVKGMMDVCRRCGGINLVTKCFQERLQQAVIAGDPIDYYYDNLPT